LSREVIDDVISRTEELEDQLLLWCLEGGTGVHNRGEILTQQEASRRGHVCGHLEEPLGRKGKAVEHRNQTTDDLAELLKLRETTLDLRDRERDNERDRQRERDREREADMNTDREGAKDGNTSETEEETERERGQCEAKGSGKQRHLPRRIVSAPDIDDVVVIVAPPLGQTAEERKS
jgi:hypothetical protein